MNDIPDFDKAIESFGWFLTEQGHPADVFWVFREDIWKPSYDCVVLRIPSQTKNRALAKKVFEDGRNKGLVEILAIATAGDRVAATVWFPKFEDEEVQGWNRGMMLSIAQPLPIAHIVGPLKWLFVSLKPQLRHYQRFEWRVGTKAWAAAQQAVESHASVRHLDS